MKMVGHANGGAVKVPNTNGLTFYYHYYSYYSQKVLMGLYEKKVDFVPVVVDITKGEQYSTWFLDINPRGEVPVLKDGDNVIPDSSKILDYLEKGEFKDTTPSLIDVDTNPAVQKKIIFFRDLIDALPAGVITMGSLYHPELCENPKVPFILPVRKMLRTAEMNSSNKLREYAQLHESARDTLLGKADFQDKKHQLVTDKQEYIKLLNIVDRTLQKVETELTGHGIDSYSWLCSKHFTIADVNLAILLERLNGLGLEKRFWSQGKRPHLERYFQRVQERPSFRAAVPDLFFHIRIVLESQPPAVQGALAATAVGIVLASLYVVKRIIF